MLPSLPSLAGSFPRLSHSALPSLSASVRIDAGAKAFTRSLDGPPLLTSTILLLLIILCLFFLFTFIVRLLTSLSGRLIWYMWLFFNTLLAISVLILVLLIVVEAIEAIGNSGVAGVITIKPSGGGELGDLVLAGQGQNDLKEIQVATALAALFYVGLVVLPFWWKAYKDRKKGRRHILSEAAPEQDNKEDEGEEEDENEERVRPGEAGMGGMDQSSASMAQYPGPVPMPRVPPYPPASAMQWAQDLNADRSPWSHPRVVFAGPRRRMRRIDLEDIEIGDLIGPPPQGGFYGYPGFGWPGMQQTPQGIQGEGGEEEETGRNRRSEIARNVVLARIWTLQRAFWMPMIWFLVPLILGTVLAILMAGFRGVRDISGRGAITVQDTPVVRLFRGRLPTDDLAPRFSTAQELASCQNLDVCDPNVPGRSCPSGSFISNSSAEATFECLSDAADLPERELARGIAIFFNDCLRRNTGDAIGLQAFVRTCSAIGAGNGEVHALAVLFLVLSWIIITSDFIGLFWSTSISPIILFWFGFLVAVAALTIASIGLSKVSGGDTVELLFAIAPNNIGRIYVGAYESSRAILAPALILFFLQVIGASLVYRPHKIYPKYDLDKLTPELILVDPFGASWAWAKKSSKKRKERAPKSESDEISSGPERAVMGMGQGMGQGMGYGMGYGMQQRMIGDGEDEDSS